MSRLTLALRTSKKKVIYLMPTGSLKYRSCVNPHRTSSGEHYHNAPLYAFLTVTGIARTQIPQKFKVYTPALAELLEA